MPKDWCKNLLDGWHATGEVITHLFLDTLFESHNVQIIEKRAAGVFSLAGEDAMDIYYSYACRDSYLVYAWLKRMEKRGHSLDVRWRPFAIQMDDPNNIGTSHGNPPIRN